MHKALDQVGNLIRVTDETVRRSFDVTYDAAETFIDIFIDILTNLSSDSCSGLTGQAPADSACDPVILRQVVLLFVVFASLCLSPLTVSAEDGWSFEGQSTLFYTDDVGLFSATRRLSRDGDPTQPAIDSHLTNKGSDMNGTYLAAT